MSGNPDESDFISFMSALYRVSCPSSHPVTGFAAISKLGLMSSLKLRQRVKPGLKHRWRPKETNRDLWWAITFFFCLFLYWTWVLFCHVCELAACSVSLSGGRVPLQPTSLRNIVNSYTDSSRLTAALTPVSVVWSCFQKKNPSSVTLYSVNK